MPSRSPSVKRPRSLSVAACTERSRSEGPGAEPAARQNSPETQIHRLATTLFAVLLFLTLPYALSSQAYSLRTFSVDAGLAQSQVYASLYDSRGLLWFGTQGGGLSYFDGITFQTINEKDGLGSNYIRSIFEDSQRNLWIGTDGGGLSRYNGQTIENFGKKEGLSSMVVNSITEDGKGKLWLGTNNGIDILDPSTRKFTHYDKSNGLVSSLVTTLLQDKEGNWWIGTNLGLNILPKGKDMLRSNLLRFDRYRGLPESNISHLMEDSQGRVWVSTYGGGAAMYNPRTNALDQARPFQPFGRQQGLNASVVFSTNEDSKGNIWFGTLDHGAQRWNGEYFTNFTQSEGLYSNHVRVMVEDAWGNIWLGTSGGGVSRFAGDQFVHFNEKNGLKGNRVYTVVADTAGNMWFGTSAGGVVKYNGSTFERFGEESGFTEKTVKASLLDSKGNIWFGTEGTGVAKYDGRRFKIYMKSDGLGGMWVKDILEDHLGRIWFALAGGGVSYFEDGRFTQVNGEGLTTDRFNCIAEDPAGNIWLGSSDRGIFRYDGQQFQQYTAEDGLGSPIIRSVAMDSHGDLWWGTANGLAYLERKPQGKVAITNFTEEEGLASDNIYLTLFDGAGNLWTGTERGVDKVILNEGGQIREVRQFGSAEGFIGIETCQKSAFLDAQGNLWFGTINGVTRHNPRENERNHLPPLTHITGVNLFYSRLHQMPGAQGITPWYGLPIGLVLPYDQNHLSFEFIGINHKNPAKVGYKWKLEGANEDWTPINSRREATYSNLPPGHYAFRLKAYNEDGISGNEEERFEFDIRPPWWATWWFRIIAGAVLILVVYAVFQIRIRQIKRESESLNRKVTMEKQMLELEQKALRLQMNPHFIFNALNSIKGCMAANDVPAARKYLVKFAQLMRLILDNSRETFISVDKELKTLELYLDLEKLSKADKFDYRFQVDSAIHPDLLGIPPMIVQPFVENAVIHGVTPLKEKGLIEIEFKREGETLVCRVRDNGVGRERANELKQSRDGVHKSKGITVTEERLQLLQEGVAEEYKVRFTDLTDAEGNPTGTEVEIRMPYREM